MEDPSVENINWGDCQTVRCNPEKYTCSKIEIFENYRRPNNQTKEYENVDQQDDWGDTPLHRAVESDNVDEIERLLEKNARCDISNELDQTPLSLMLNKENYGAHLQRSFIKHGCLFMRHYNSDRNRISFLLQNNAQQFNKIIETSIRMEDIEETIDLLRQLFFMAKNNTKYTQGGTIVNIKDIDCFIKIKLSDLHHLFGESVVNDVKTVVDLYKPAQFFVELCITTLYDRAEETLKQYPLLQSDIRLSRYIMSELLADDDEKCWKFLLEHKFDPKTLHPYYGTILHGAASTLNENALYFLVYYGASVKAEDSSGRNPIERLEISLRIPNHKQRVLFCLASIDKALEKRIHSLERSLGRSNELHSLYLMRSCIRDIIKK